MKSLDCVGYCEYCQRNVLKDSKHCRRCNRCVRGFDHHCRFVNQCVGRRNYRLFIILLVLIVIDFTIKLTYLAYDLSISLK